MHLGAGRKTIDDKIDPNVGIHLHKQVGEYANVGDTLLDLYVNDEWDDKLINDLLNAYEFSDFKFDPPKVIDEIIS